MERLTEYHFGERNAAYMVYSETCNDDISCEDCAEFEKIIDRLAAYEDAMPLERAQELAQAEKDRRLVVLPCKVGGRVYRVITARDADPVMTEIEIKTLGQAADLIGRIGEKRTLVSWYLTRGEAEAAMKNREAARDD